MGSHSVTCHPTQVNVPNSSHAGWYSIYLPRNRMQDAVDQLLRQQQATPPQHHKTTTGTILGGSRFQERTRSTKS